MMFHPSYLFFFICICSTIKMTSSAASATAYNPTEVILLSCGATTITNDASHRSWDSDQGSKYMPLNIHSSTMEPSVFAVPYETARVFYSPFTYTFPLSGGQKFLRLYFYSNNYSSVDTYQSLFSVKANAFTLLTNFSAFLYSKSLGKPSFLMEFIVYIGATQTLDLTFIPNPKSYAFVNGIEIVSIPDKLYLDEEGKQIKMANTLFYLNSNSALQNLYRLNVGGASVSIEEDSGMFRSWRHDDDYLFCCDYGWTRNDEEIVIHYTNNTPPYTAPPAVYTSARTMTNTSTNLDWEFPVDSGFYYMLRFHFCDFVHKKENDSSFTIIINDKTVGN